MAIRFRCSCGQKMKTADHYADRMVQCKSCGKILKVPACAKRDEPSTSKLLSQDQKSTQSLLLDETALLPARGPRWGPVCPACHLTYPAGTPLCPACQVALVDEALAEGATGFTAPLTTPGYVRRRRMAAARETAPAGFLACLVAAASRPWSQMDLVVPRLSEKKFLSQVGAFFLVGFGITVAVEFFRPALVGKQSASWRIDADSRAQGARPGRKAVAGETAQWHFLLVVDPASPVAEAETRFAVELSDYPSEAAGPPDLFVEVRRAAGQAGVPAGGSANSREGARAAETMPLRQAGEATLFQASHRFLNPGSYEVRIFRRLPSDQAGVSGDVIEELWYDGRLEVSPSLAQQQAAWVDQQIERMGPLSGRLTGALSAALLALLLQGLLLALVARAFGSSGQILPAVGLSAMSAAVLLCLRGAWFPAALFLPEVIGTGLLVALWGWERMLVVWGAMHLGPMSPVAAIAFAILTGTLQFGLAAWLAPAMLRTLL